MSMDVILISAAEHEGLPLGIGLNFTHAHTTSADFAESRLALLTGQYQQRGPKTRIEDIIPLKVTEFLEKGGLQLIECRRWEGGTEELDPEAVIVATSPNPVGDDYSTPLVIRWPGVTKPGTTCSELVSTLDIVPTIAAITGVDTRPNAPLSVDGMNLTPVIRYGAAAHRALFYDGGEVITIDAHLKDGRLTAGADSPDTVAALTDQWNLWHNVMAMGPLQ
ncbi:sulfatase/phosphatase domain-containing protein [Corynebacterium pyruviciproducens]|uniref:sulfatase/phosphatase domain-containing protein n=1 Tax=Corynebacterium pyruviciproducens TaxID=598660 RepID=UPI00255066A0|nr:sulfatase/phosphatase domain-containing protein [Corynebacterium pyruviciproducens]MDK7213486.1 hypothetical protein [Corynebacterium pyruviciproducens]